MATTGAAKFLQTLAARGISALPEGDANISVSPSKLLTDGDRHFLRAHKVDVLAELQNGEHVNLVNIDSGRYPAGRIVHDQETKFTDDDPYAKAERLAIQWESELPPETDPTGTGTADIAGFEVLPDLTTDQHGVILRRVMKLDQPQPAPAAPVRTLPKTAGYVFIDYESATDAIPAVSVAPEPAIASQPAPATVTCGSCVRFQPGTTKMGIGVCLATTNGLPPKEQRGYLAAFPMALRRCPEYAGSAS